MSSVLRFVLFSQFVEVQKRPGYDFRQARLVQFGQQVRVVEVLFSFPYGAVASGNERVIGHEVRGANVSWVKRADEDQKSGNSEFSPHASPILEGGSL